MNTRLTNTGHAALNQSIAQVAAEDAMVEAIAERCIREGCTPESVLNDCDLDEGIIKRVVGAVKNTMQRVKNAPGHGFKTDAQVAKSKADRQARWSREDSAAKAKRDREAAADRDASRKEREDKTFEIRRRAKAAGGSGKRFSSAPWEGHVDE